MRLSRLATALAVIVACPLLAAAPAAAADEEPLAAEPLSAPLIEEWGKPAGAHPAS